MPHSGAQLTSHSGRDQLCFGNPGQLCFHGKWSFQEPKPLSPSNRNLVRELSHGGDLHAVADDRDLDLSAPMCSAGAVAGPREEHTARRVDLAGHDLAHGGLRAER